MKKRISKNEEKVATIKNLEGEIKTIKRGRKTFGVCKIVATTQVVIIMTPC